MTGWIERLPPAEHAVAEFPACDTDEAFELQDLYVDGASAASVETFEKPEIVNVAMHRCDIAGFVAQGGRGSRVLLAECRLRGVSWAGATIQDAVVRDVRGADFSLRFSTLRRVVFNDCDIQNLDLSEVTFDDVLLQRCVLRGAEFHRARVKQLRIEGCDLSGCTGAESLGGASVHPDDLLNLAPSLATALGLRVEHSASAV